MKRHSIYRDCTHYNVKTYVQHLFSITFIQMFTKTQIEELQTNYKNCINIEDTHEKNKSTKNEKNLLVLRVVYMLH